MTADVFYWLTAFLALACTQADAKTRRRQIWDPSGEYETSSLPQPVFKKTPDRVTFKQGLMAKLECLVDHLGTKKVIWRRKSDPNPLTIGRRTFVEDDRITVEHVPLGPDWHLIIRQVRLDDEGVYECQISSTDRDLRQYIYLTVKPGDLAPPAGPEINITGKTYVEKNRKIRLVCNATGADHSPDSLDWFMNGQKLVTDVDKKLFIQMQVSLMEKTISSILEIEEADMEDAGIYVCRTSDLQVVSTRVDVLNADTNNVKRGTEKDSAIDNLARSAQASMNQRGSKNLAVGPEKVWWQTIICLLLTTLLNHFPARLLLPT